MDGLQPFILRRYQKDFIRFWDEMAETGPVRINVGKPRQAGFSTTIAGKFAHFMGTMEDYRLIAMADKSGRTAEIQSIFSTFANNLPGPIRPMISKDNTEELVFDNPSKKASDKDKNPGLRSSVKFETAQDPNAGRSGSRRGAHLSETAFYRYYREIDEGVQNSIPLAKGTAIIKESTGNGRSGIGKPHYDLWKAAERGDSIYRNYFVSWFEIDDYQMNVPLGFRVTPEEREILKMRPNVTEANLVWRRLKVMEYLGDESDQFLTPAERFKQDFPLTPDEMFRHSGQPVFDAVVIERIIKKLESFRPRDMSELVSKNDYMLRNYINDLRIYAPPREGKQYFIGADIAEGLAQGDYSSLCLMDSEYKQIGSWHGKIDPDLFGHLLISLGRLYNNALLIPENNNMGHTTVTTIRNEGYYPLYTTIVEDKVSKERTTKYGWKTTQKSKQDMLNEAIKHIRDNDAKLLDIGLLREMEIISRGDNGNVDLNGKDRVVAFCLTLMGLKHYRSPIEVKKKRVSMATGTGQEIHEAFMKQKKKKGNDLFD